MSRFCWMLSFISLIEKLFIFLLSSVVLKALRTYYTRTLVPCYFGCAFYETVIMPFQSPYGNVPIIDRPVHEIILEGVLENSKKFPNKSALIDSESGKKYSYYQVYYLSHSLATFLHRKGLKKGDVVLLCLPNCIEYAVITLGTSLRGGVTSGVNSVYTEYELNRQMKDSDCKFVFTMDIFLEKVLAAAKDCGNQIKEVIAIRTEMIKPMEKNVTDFYDSIRNEPNFNLPRVNFNTKNDLFLLPYSSGTTGVPKGVMVTHYNAASICAVFRRWNDDFFVPNIDNFIMENEVNLAFLPLFHIYGFSLVLNYLRLGIQSVTVGKFVPDQYLALIQQYKVKTLALVPPVVVFLAKHPMVDDYNLSSVQAVISGAAPVGKELTEELLKRHSHIKYLLQGYGMTEMSLASHLPWPGRAPSGSTGYLMSNMECMIMDPETGKELGPNQKGEVWVRGPNVMKGYLNRAQATAETVDRNGWLHTGDIGYCNKDGCLFVVDRLKELIKVKGFQVPPAELEDLLLTNSSIQDAAVIGVPDVESGELPRAYVVLKAGKHMNQQEVERFVEERVAHYKRLKGGVEFVKEIPKSPSGKILRRLLKDKAIVSKL